MIQEMDVSCSDAGYGRDPGDGWSCSDTGDGWSSSATGDGCEL